MNEMKQYQYVGSLYLHASGELRTKPIYDTNIKQWFLESVKKVANEDTLALSNVSHQSANEVIDSIFDSFENAFETKFASVILSLAYINDHFVGQLSLNEIINEDTSGRQSEIHAFNLQW